MTLHSFRSIRFSKNLNELTLLIRKMPIETVGIIPSKK
jgi:hypothetical protein